MRNEKSWIQTWTGKKFFPLDPKQSDLDIRDQAHALSMVCRYAGHVDRFYSVAEHAVRLCIEAQRRHLPLELQKWALIHDNSEAYLGDVTRPLKHSPEMKLYRVAEARLQEMIAVWLGLPYEEPRQIKDLDFEILGTETHHLKQPVHPEWGATTSAGVLPKPWIGHEELGWNPADAEGRYLHKFKQLWGDIGFGLCS